MVNKKCEGIPATVHPPKTSAAMKGDFMEIHNASIYKNEKLVLEDVQVSLNILNKRWTGTFQLIKYQHFEPGEKFRLRLDDGRSGEIFIENEHSSSHGPTRLSFVGTGHLI